MSSLRSPAPPPPSRRRPRGGHRPGPAGRGSGLGVVRGPRHSYTAGPLIPVQLPDPLGCWRSDRNYPDLVAAARASALRDVSCSGAETEDLFATQEVAGGPNPPQLDALHAAVDLVSVQIGGNDIGFSEILQRCMTVVPLGTPCQDAYVQGGTDELSRRIAATAPAVAAVLAEIRHRAPQARILVVGYPAILPEHGPGCWPLLPIAPGDVPYLRDTEKRLNAMLATQAAAAGPPTSTSTGRASTTTPVSCPWSAGSSL